MRAFRLPPDSPLSAKASAGVTHTVFKINDKLSFIFALSGAEALHDSDDDVLQIPEDNLSLLFNMDAVYGQASDNKVGGAPKVVERKQQEKVPEKGWKFRQV